MLLQIKKRKLPMAAIFFIRSIWNENFWWGPTNETFGHVHVLSEKIC